MCVDAITHLWQQCSLLGAEFTLWNLPVIDFGEQPYSCAEEFRVQMEGVAMSRMSDQLFTSYLLTIAIIHAYTQVMEMERVDPSDIKVVCGFFRQIARIVDNKEAVWPEEAGDPALINEEMENFLLSMAAYPSVSRLPPAEATGFIKRNYVPTIASLSAILIQVGEEYLITEVIPPCDCWNCQIGRGLANTERMVSRIGQMLQQLMEDLSEDDVTEDIRHPDDV